MIKKERIVELDEIGKNNGFGEMTFNRLVKFEIFTDGNFKKVRVTKNGNETSASSNCMVCEFDYVVDYTNPVNCFGYTNSCDGNFYPFVYDSGEYNV